MTSRIHGRALRGLAAAMAIAMTGPAIAAGPAAYLDLMYVPHADLDFSAVEDDVRVSFDEADAGYGLRGAVMLSRRLFASGEFTSNEYSGYLDAQIGTAPDVAVKGDLAFEMIRLGLGGILIDGPLQAFVTAEWIRADLEFEAAGFDAEASDNGYGIHLGGRGSAGPLALTLQAGYVDVGEGDGLEWSAELAYSLNRIVGLFVGYRSTVLEAAEGSEYRERYTFGDARIGVTLNLNR